MSIDMTKVAVFASLILLLSACSDIPSDHKVRALIETQYEQESKALVVASDKVSSNKVSAEKAEGFDKVIQNAMATLDSVENISCADTDSESKKNDNGESSYLCTADITQTMNGHTSTNQASFRIKRVNNRWTLAL